MAIINSENLKELMKNSSKVNGEVIEIGVFVAETFHRLAPLANSYGKKAYAVDSFAGMAEPLPQDLVSGNQYPKGRLSNGGVEKFKKIMKNYGVNDDIYECVEGYVPNVFKKFDVSNPETEFSFALIDLDHYLPTKHALSWVWPKLNKNGILVLDDYFRDIPELAALGIDEWIKENLHFMDFKVEALINTQLFIRKLVK